MDHVTVAWMLAMPAQAHKRWYTSYHKLALHYIIMGQLKLAMQLTLRQQSLKVVFMPQIYCIAGKFGEH